MNEFQKAIINIYDRSKVTNLYMKLVLRGGKLAIHKGSTNPEILFIGEAPGKNEDKIGAPFVGRSGKVLDEWVKFLPNKEIAVINAVPIMPEKDGKIRKPKKEEIEYFKPSINKLITAMKPKYIIMLGRSANECMMNYNFKCSEWLYCENKGIHYGFIYHPSYFIRKGQNGKKEFINLIKKME